MFHGFILYTSYKTFKGTLKRILKGLKVRTLEPPSTPNPTLNPKEALKNPYATLKLGFEATSEKQV